MNIVDANELAETLDVARELQHELGVTLDSVQDAGEIRALMRWLITQLRQLREADQGPQIN